MKPFFIFLIVLLVVTPSTYAAQLDPANQALPLPSAEAILLEQQTAVNDTTELARLADEVEEQSSKALKNYIISAGLGLGAFLIALAAVASNAPSVAILALLLALGGVVFSLISFFAMIKGFMRLGELDDLLAMPENAGYRSRFRARVSRPRNVLKVLLILTIVSFVLNLISSALGQ